MTSRADILKKHPVKNIYTYPLDEPSPLIDIPKKNGLIIPDLHANPILALQYLLRSQIMHWNNEGDTHWKTICEFYQEPLPSLNDQDAVTAYLKKFKDHYEDLLLLATFDTTKPLLFLGDMIGDRGVNDWFILLLLSVLDENNVPFTITFSNHDCETYLWAQVDHFSDHISKGTIANGQRVSLVNFNGLYPFANTVLKRRMRDVYREVYLPHVVLFAYAHDKANDFITICTHAPGSFQLILDTANDFAITIPDLETSHQFTQLLDACNDSFAELLLNHPNILSEFFTPFTSWRNEERHYPALLRAIWGRNYECQKRRHSQPDTYRLQWICGHLGSRSQPVRITNLDRSNLGKREFGLNYEFGTPQKPMIDCTHGNLCFAVLNGLK